MRGFTLLELLVVLTLLAIISGSVMLAISGGQERHIQREAERVAAMLEAARAESRAAGVAVRAILQDGGISFSHRPDVHTWLYPATRASLETESLLLGPEPLIAPQRLTLTLGQQRVHIATNGLAPFSVVTHAPQ